MGYQTRTPAYEKNDRETTGWPFEIFRNPADLFVAPYVVHVMMVWKKKIGIVGPAVPVRPCVRTDERYGRVRCASTTAVGELCASKICTGELRAATSPVSPGMPRDGSALPAPHF